MSPIPGHVVAVIPARAGSVGVPGKNLREVGGVPLVARAVACALASSSIDHVVVSTDGEEIARVAAEAGAEVIVRPAALSTGSASSESAVTHALDVLEDAGVEPAIVVFMQATSPFTRPEDIDEAVARVAGGEHDVVLAAVETHAFLWNVDSVGNAQGVNHDPSFRPMRQDREPQYQETGAFYAMDAAGFRRTGYRFFGRVGFAVIPDAIDIDTEEDLAVADVVARTRDMVTVGAAAAGPAGRVATAERTRIEASLSQAGLDTRAPSVRATRPAEVREVRAMVPELVEGRPAEEPENPTLSSIEAVVTDFDGVHTDDSVQVDQNGVESVTVNRRDGLGVRMLREAGIPVLILSTEKNPVVGVRAAKLGVDVLQGIGDKAAALTAWAADARIRLDRVAYLGNDVNDLGALGAVGWPFAVADAHPRAIAASRRVLTASGGAGAVRELAEIILEEKAKS
ncbi:acylneuraminate cytidylyltransferase [Humibacter sp. RRB41]|uniref:acylneuraminate cytidylyltransferase n=1 Tax=Humibacter sp. RRB41 TaxID=2919946 RepID=UPI001FAA0BBB|nr:acylneuraminate cytidylyltransferase [Humibacter sp. RRB41]